MTQTKKVETELTRLKAKCLNKDGSPKKGATGIDLARLKQLQDAEPLTKDELAEAQNREAKRHEEDVKAFQAKQEAKIVEKVLAQTTGTPTSLNPALDKVEPAEHPRITTLKQALMPFTMLEVHESRPDEFILINRGTAITAGDVRAARKAIKI